MSGLNQSFANYLHSMTTREFLSEHDAFGLTEEEMDEVVEVAQLYVHGMEDVEAKAELVGMFLGGFMFATYYAKNRDFMQLLDTGKENQH